MKIVIATRNRDKLREMSDILRINGIEFLGLDSFPDCPEVPEEGSTFEENALQKARTAACHSGCWALADDSGLAIDALGGRPGVFSARFAGPAAGYRDNSQKVLSLLRDVPDQQRTAKFVCVIVVAGTNNRAFFASGELPGLIIREFRGENGFGYDPIFFLPEHGQTLAEMAPGVKNSISHRARALEKIKPLLIHLSKTNA